MVDIDFIAFVVFIHPFQNATQDIILKTMMSCLSFSQKHIHMGGVLVIYLFLVIILIRAQG